MNSKQMYKHLYTPSIEYPMWKYHIDTFVEKVLKIFKIGKEN